MVLAQPSNAFDLAAAAAPSRSLCFHSAPMDHMVTHVVHERSHREQNAHCCHCISVVAGIEASNQAQQTRPHALVLRRGVCYERQKLAPCCISIGVCKVQRGSGNDDQHQADGHLRKDQDRVRRGPYTSDTTRMMPLTRAKNTKCSHLRRWCSFWQSMLKFVPCREHVTLWTQPDATAANMQHFQHV